MSLHVHNITVDCADARGLATFWAGLLGWNVYYDDDPEVVVAPSFPPSVTGMLFIPVPEGKSAKNRLHLDLQPDDMTRDEAVERAVASGATVIGDHRHEDGSGWVTLADPEGNEFCIERGEAESGPRAPRAFRIGS
ncbi:glyoxalase [Intrasporangium oryzae NRRL B-24470]|uniref:Glyoxalase n=1 Tax=Intrasporangium oryzae NRRL B-24470 TaxID=1386089 RepID=W9G5K4_9MICO|nr:VOC family protein [Intrasporangium oryzae]EWT01315.1 glyoxalase [Intrasporangium oryzae NRRL B-24470]